MPNGRHEPMKTVESIDHVVSNWPWASAKIAKDMTARYGLPHEATDSMLIWHYNDPWLKTIVWRDGVHHGFPRSHLDLVEQTLAYRVPMDKVQLLAEYNGSITVNRTKGELIVCCANEAMSLLTMNLAHEIIIGHTTPQQARIRHKEMVAALRLMWPEPYTQALQFTVVRGGYGTGESDESVASYTGPFRHHHRSK